MPATDTRVFAENRHFGVRAISISFFAREMPWESTVIGVILVPGDTLVTDDDCG